MPAKGRQQSEHNMNATLAKNRGGISESNPLPTTKMVLRLGETRVAEFQIGTGKSAGGTGALEASFQKPDRVGGARVGRPGGWSDERPQERWGLNE
jgi:hypothetical protein